MRCSRRSGVFPFCWVIIPLSALQQLDLFSARSARARGFRGNGEVPPKPSGRPDPLPARACGPGPGVRIFVCVKAKSISKPEHQVTLLSFVRRNPFCLPLGGAGNELRGSLYFTRKVQAGPPQADWG